MALGGAWLGGELVETLGISVRPDAGVDAPSPFAKGATRVPAERHA